MSQFTPLALTYKGQKDHQQKDKGTDARNQY